jgi:hypothetical protein
LIQSLGSSQASILTDVPTHYVPRAFVAHRPHLNSRGPQRYICRPANFKFSSLSRLIRPPKFMGVLGDSENSFRLERYRRFPIFTGGDREHPMCSFFFPDERVGAEIDRMNIGFSVYLPFVREGTYLKTMENPQEGSFSGYLFQRRKI